MNFYTILEDRSDYNISRVRLLEKAAKKRGLDFHYLVACETDMLMLPTLTKGDLLYRVGPGSKATNIEKLLLNYQPTTFYTSNLLALRSQSATPFFLSQNRSTLTIPFIAALPNNLKQASKYVEYLGGFPITIKIIGSSHGVGVIKVDSLDGLMSLRDYLEHSSVTGTVFMRRYIEHNVQARLVVLGDKVVASHANLRTSDFRTNVGDTNKRQRKAEQFNQTIEKLAIESVRTMGIELGGVDVLIEVKTNRAYVSEVNFPFYFPTTQKLTGVDIAGAMIDYLIEKNKKAN